METLIKDLNEGDIFISKKGSEGKYLKSLDNGEHLLLSLTDNKEYRILDGNIKVFKKDKLNIKCGNVFEDILTYENNFFNTIYSDVPYNLSSKWIIDKETGRFVIKGKPKDFMNKWDGFDENTLDLFMKESFRTLKYGGYLILYGIDRQLSPFQYYAVKNGFEIHQSLYWYFINSMPKGCDAGKMIDKRGGKNYIWFGKWIEKRLKELNLTQHDISKHFLSKTGGLTGRVHNWITGKTIPTIKQFNKLCELLDAPFDNIEELKREVIGRGRAGLTKGNIWSFSGKEEFDITAPASDLSKQFNGYKYGIASLKQCVETIMVFHKPCKNGSVLNDLLTSERDLSISPSVLNINENRVPVEDKESYEFNMRGNERTSLEEGERFTKDKTYDGGWKVDKTRKEIPKGRYPSQVLISDDASKIIDNQSGILKSGYMSPDKHKKNKTAGKYQSERGIYGVFNNGYLMETYGDKGGCSRILHHCNYEKGEYDLLNYCKKSTKTERNLGLTEEGTGSNTYNRKCLKCGKWARKQQFSDNYTCHCEKPEWEKPTGNLHLTVKPISLNYRILNLFKLPDECNQKIYIPFFGSGSEIIGAIKAKYKEENIYGCEIDKEYVSIAEKRIKYWSNKFKNEKI